MENGQQRAGGHDYAWNGLRWAAAIAVSGVAAWLSARRIHWQSLRDSLSGANLPLLALGLAAVVCTTAVKAVRWHLLLSPTVARLDGFRVFRILVIGQMGNGFLPARAGDIARAVLAGREGPGAAEAFGTIVSEKILDGVTGMLLLLCLAAAGHFPAWLRWPALAAGAVVAAFVIFILAVEPLGRACTARAAMWRSQQTAPHVRSTFAAQTRKHLLRLARHISLGFNVLAQPRILIAGLALSATVWGFGIATNQIILAASAVQVPIWANLLVVIAVYLASLLPAAPAQIGVFEYACVTALGAAQVPPAAALAFALLLHLVVYSPPALLGPVFAAVEGLRWSTLGRRNPADGQRSG